MNILLLIILVVVALCWITITSFGHWAQVQRLMFDSHTPPETFDRPADHPQHTATLPQTLPGVTVIVPGRNEGHVLLDTLGSICRQDYPTFRVVFVDDQSTDNTAEIARPLATQFPHLKIIHNIQSPPPGRMW